MGWQEQPPSPGNQTPPPALSGACCVPWGHVCACCQANLEQRGHQVLSREALRGPLRQAQSFGRVNPTREGRALWHSNAPSSHS